MEDWKEINQTLTKTFTFVSFEEAIRFMNMCKPAIDEMNHHPQWCNTYNIVSVVLTTHDKGGITEKDFALRDEMDKVAKNIM